jgi:predicted DNA-binding transcriptional regulator AlpA
VDVDELLSSSQVAKRLGISRQRVDQLVEAGRLPAPVGRSGRNRMWKESDIELAVAGSDPSSGRMPVPDWATVPVPDPPLPKVVDEVLPVPGVWVDKAPRVHVRIWRGPVASVTRTVVLYGALEESHGIIVNYAETIARTIAARHLSVGEARNAWWFGFWPRGMPRKNLSVDYVSFAFPRTTTGAAGLLDTLLRRGLKEAWDGEFTHPLWRRVERGDLARVIGSEPDLDFPEGTYTAAVVQALAAGTRPVVVEFDPYKLRAQVRRVMTLNGYRRALLSGAEQQADRPALALLRGADHATAARTADALNVVEELFAVTAQGAVQAYRKRAAVDDPGAALVERRWYSPGPSEMAVLDHHVKGPSREGDPAYAGAVERSLSVVRKAREALAEAEETGSAQADADLLKALERAEPDLLSVRHLLDPRRVDDPGPVPQSIYEIGEAEAAYLATVSWWGPAAGDVHRAARLRGHLWEKDQEAARTGYDPFGRVVLHSPESGVLVVERPRALPAEPYPDDAELLGTPDSMTVFVRLPDGRCDILPSDPRSTYTDVTWGYDGTGPDTLATALSFAVLDHPDPDHPQTLDERPPAVREHLEHLVTKEVGSKEPFRMTAGAVRNARS